MPDVMPFSVIVRLPLLLKVNIDCGLLISRRQVVAFCYAVNSVLFDITDDATKPGKSTSITSYATT